MQTRTLILTLAVNLSVLVPSIAHSSTEWLPESTGFVYGLGELEVYKFNPHETIAAGTLGYFDITFGARSTKGSWLDRQGFNNFLMFEPDISYFDGIEIFAFLGSDWKHVRADIQNVTSSFQRRYIGPAQNGLDGPENNKTQVRFIGSFSLDETTSSQYIFEVHPSDIGLDESFGSINLQAKYVGIDLLAYVPLTVDELPTHGDTTTVFAELVDIINLFNTYPDTPQVRYSVGFQRVNLQPGDLDFEVYAISETLAVGAVSAVPLPPSVICMGFALASLFRLPLFRSGGV